MAIARLAAIALLLASACTERAAGDLRPVPVGDATLLVERGARESDFDVVTVELKDSIQRVEALFGRRFEEPPDVLFFSSEDAFRQGATEILGYAAGDAERLASGSGGVFDPSTRRIVVNGGRISPERMPAILTHELTHKIVREASGSAELPAWFEEGVATDAESTGTIGGNNGTVDVLGRAVVANGGVRLLDVATLTGWHQAYARIGPPLYAYARTAILLMKERIGWDGVLAILRAVREGATFESAYEGRSGESLAEFEARERGASGPAIVVDRDASGDARWTLLTAPDHETQVAISGASTYVVSFTVRTDEWGLYRGSFGSTAPRGTYVISAAGAQAEFDTRP